MALSEATRLTGKKDPLARLIEGHQVFLEGVFNALKSIEELMAQRSDWALVQHNGHAVARDGWGENFANFPAADWVMTHAAIAFAPSSRLQEGSTTVTPIDTDGLPIVGFQARWLEKSPVQPTLWGLALTARLKSGDSTGKWESYHRNFFNQVSSNDEAPRFDEDVKPGQKASGVAVARGQYISVPLTKITNEAYLQTKVIDRTLRLLDKSEE